MLEWSSFLCLLIGSFLCITGGVGLLRLPDFFSRVHATGVTESLAAPLLLMGLMLQMDWSLELVKVLLIIVFVLATNPTASNAMAKAAMHDGYEPLVIEQDAKAKEGAPSQN